MTRLGDILSSRPVNKVIVINLKSGRRIFINGADENLVFNVNNIIKSFSYSSVGALNIGEGNQVISIPYTSIEFIEVYGMNGLPYAMGPNDITVRAK